MSPHAQAFSTRAIRKHPESDRELRLSDISGSWLPYRADGCMLAICWGHTQQYWAPLHDFDQTAQATLIRLCREHDRDVNRLTLMSRRGAKER